MATQTLSRVPAMISDKQRAFHPEEPSVQQQRRIKSPIYVPPNEFRMKLLKRILSVDGTIDNKALQKLQRASSDRTLQANILFQNGDVGTLISFDRYTDTELFNDKPDVEPEAESTPNQSLPSLQSEDLEKTQKRRNGEKRERPLKLPPIMLPPIYAQPQRPLFVRDFSGPPFLPPPLTEDDWEDLEDCRYLRPAKKHFNDSKATKSFLL